jgi:hypothetical protein
VKTLKFRNSFEGDLRANPTANRQWDLPDRSGTLGFLFSEVITVTGNKTLAIADISTFQQIDSASAITITVPADATTNFPLGSEISLHQDNIGQITLNAASGAAIRREGSTATTGHLFVGRYSLVVIKKVAANEWRAFGGLTWA